MSGCVAPECPRNSPDVRCPRTLPAFAGSPMRRLQPAQEIKELLALCRGQGEECLHRWRRFAIMGNDRRVKSGGPAIMQITHPITEPPKRGGAPVAAARLALPDAVVERRAHVVQQKIGIQRYRSGGSRQLWHMAGSASGTCKERRGWGSRLRLG